MPVGYGNLKDDVRPPRTANAEEAYLQRWAHEIMKKNYWGPDEMAREILQRGLSAYEKGIFEDMPFTPAELIAASKNGRILVAIPYGIRPGRLNLYAPKGGWPREIFSPEIVKVGWYLLFYRSPHTASYSYDLM